MRQVAVKLAEAKAMAEPYVKTASDKATPLVLKAVEVTAPYRAQAGEAYATHKGTFDEKVGNPVAEVSLELVLVDLLGSFNPFRAPKSLPILTLSQFVKKKRYPAVTALIFPFVAHGQR